MENNSQVQPNSTESAAQAPLETSPQQVQTGLMQPSEEVVSEANQPEEKAGLSTLVKIILWVFGTLIILSAVGFFGWTYVRASPQYSLYQMELAVENHDYSSFSKYFDVDTFATNFVDSVINQESGTLGPLGLALISALKPQLIDKVRTEIKNDIEQGNSQPLNFNLGNFWTAYQKTTVIQNGNEASVVVKPSDSSSKSLGLKMKKIDGYWQVFDIDIDLQLQASASAIPSGQSAQPTPSTTSKTAKYGERFSINEGWFVTIEAPQDYTTSSYTPKSGNKFVVVQVTYENTTSTADSFNTNYIKLKDVNDHQYDSTFSDKNPDLSSGTLEPNGKINGFLTFEIPTNEQVKSVIYNNTYSNLIVVVSQ